MDTVTFTLAEDEYVSAGKLSYVDFFRRQPSQPIMLFGCLILVSIVVGLFFESAEDGNVTWLRYGLVLVAVVSMLTLSYFVSVPASSRRSYRHNKHLHEPMTWSWDLSGFDVRTENSYSRLQWADIARFSENREFILLYPMPRLMHILPKRILTAAQINELRSLASK